MNFDLLDFQSEIKQTLLNTRNKNRLSHAYIFQGPNGVGKREMAYFFAMMLYQDNVSFDSEVSHQILSDEHVNVIKIESDSKVIKKEQVIDLQNEFSKTSQVEGPRIYIVVDADKMNQNSQNSLLKFIEEPEPGIYGILCTTNISQILPTITSRCQIINFKSLDEHVLGKTLVDNGIDQSLALLIAINTQNIDEAMALSKSDLMLKEQSIFENFLKLRKKKEALVLELSNMSFFDNIDNLSMFIRLLVVLYEDMMIMFEGSLNIYLTSYVKEITKLKDSLTKEKVRENIELLYSLNRKLLANVSPKNVIMNLFVNLF